MCVCVCLYVQVYVRVCACLCVGVCVYIFARTRNRGATYGLEGEKDMLLSMRGYLLVVSTDRTNAHNVTVNNKNSKFVCI